MSEVKSPIIALEQTLLGQLAQTQRQLDELREQLTESQRLASIGTIAAVIAHEFNNLLTPVVSYSQYALQSAKSDTPDMELIKKAGQGFRRFRESGGDLHGHAGARGGNPTATGSRCRALWMRH